MPNIQKINLRGNTVIKLEVLPENHESLYPRQIEEPSLYMFMPERLTPGAPAVLILPGGGFNKVSLGQSFDAAIWLNSLGFVCGVLGYRLPHGRHEIPQEDALAAWRYMRTHAGQWGIDTARAGIMGLSIGGLLAANWSIQFANNPEFRPAYTILHYPVISLLDPALQGLAGRYLGETPGQGALEKFSAQLHVVGNTPPALVMSSDDDPVVRPTHGVLYYTALKEKGIQASLHIFPTGGHSWGLGEAGYSGRPCPHATAAMQIMADWLSIVSNAVVANAAAYHTRG